MSSKNNNNRVAGLLPYPGFTGCSDLKDSGQSGPPFSLKNRIEHELCGIPLHQQAEVLQDLLLLLGGEDAAPTSTRDDIWDGRSLV